MRAPRPRHRSLLAGIRGGRSLQGRLDRDRAGPRVDRLGGGWDRLSGRRDLLTSALRPLRQSSVYALRSMWCLVFAAALLSGAMLASGHIETGVILAVLAIVLMYLWRVALDRGEVGG